MSRRRRRQVRNPVSDMERWQIELYALAGGFHYATVAEWVYGHKPTQREIGRVGRIIRQAGLSSLDWRRGKSAAAQNVLHTVEARAAQARAVGKSYEPQLKLVQASKRAS